MTRDEWEMLQHMAFAEWWASPLSAKTVEAWFAPLAGFAAVDVDRALQALLRTSPRFAPRLGELLVALEPAPPGFDLVWSQLCAHLGRHGADERKRGLQAVAADPALGSLVAGWAAAYGWRRLCRAPVGDPDYGGAELHHLRQSFDAATGDRADRGRLERALRAELERPDSFQIGQGEPRRLEPMRHLTGL